jgi:crossover junction endodeoxyribonuclease RusA
VGLKYLIRVVGIPVPKGSKTTFVVGGRAIITDKSNKSARDRLTPWKLAITAAIQDAVAKAGHPAPLDGALSVTMDFFLPRPKSTPKKVIYPTKKPDCDKLARTVGDVCTGVLWTDDARIVSLNIAKYYAPTGSMPCLFLNVSTLT